MKGWIYIIQFGNRDIVKVGMSEGDSPLPRIKSLDSTSVSEPIKKQETYRVDNPREVERFLHKKLIENNILKTRSDKSTEWFSGRFEDIKEIVEKNLNQIDLIESDDIKDLEAFDGLMSLNQKLTFELISKIAHDYKWESKIGLSYKDEHFLKLFYIFTYKNLYPDDYVMRKLNNLNQEDYESFQKDFINKLYTINLKNFINETSEYFPINLLHLGSAIFIIRKSSNNSLKRLLLNKWNEQIQEFTNRRIILDDLEYFELEKLEVYIVNNGRQNRV
jgi:hypothetical protein